MTTHSEILYGIGKVSLVEWLRHGRSFIWRPPIVNLRESERRKPTVEESEKARKLGITTALVVRAVECGRPRAVPIDIEDIEDKIFDAAFSLIGLDTDTAEPVHEALEKVQGGARVTVYANSLDTEWHAFGVPKHQRSMLMSVYLPAKSPLRPLFVGIHGWVSPAAGPLPTDYEPDDEAIRRKKVGQRTIALPQQFVKLFNPQAISTAWCAGRTRFPHGTYAEITRGW